MIRSFEQARLDQVFFLLNHRYPRRLLAELIWVISQENILEFLRRVPAERKCVVQFERLVEDPQREMSRLCDLIGLPFDPATLDPYGDHQKRMSDGIHPESRMLGDVKFHDHRGVEAAAANAWKKDIDPASLGEATLRLATALGYEVPAGSLHGERPALSPEKVEVPPRVSSQGPTVAKLSQHSGDLLEPIRPTGDGAAVLYIAGGFMERFWRFCRPGIRYIGASWSTPREKEFAIPRLKLSPPTIAAEISAAGLEGPYVLCGFSFAGLVAFETARQLYERNRVPALPFLLEPSTPGPWERISQSRASRVVHHLRRLPSVPRGQRAQYLQGRVKACVGLVRRWIRDRYCDARLAIGLPVPVHMRWDHAVDRYRLAIDRYVPRPFPGKVVLVKSEAYSAGCLEQWAKIAAGGLTLHDLSTPDHGDFLRDKQTVEQWIELLREHLAGVHHDTGGAEGPHG